MKKTIFLFFLIFSLAGESKLKAIENKILIKINNNIVTSVDILNEVNYLAFSNKNFRDLDNFKSYEIAKNSIIKQKIQEIELLKNFKELKIDEKYYENLIQNYYDKLGFNSYDDFSKYAKKNNVDINIIKQKITIEILWNQLIYKKFSSNIRIDKEQIKRDLSINEKIKEYLLSEIFFYSEKKENFKKKLEEIKKTIKVKGFSKAALEHSASDSSKNNGELGWIKENFISNQIKKELTKTKLGDYTNPIKVPGGFLLIKINDIRELEKEIDLEKEINLIVRKKTNDQLNQFSNIYFNKIKKNIKINEI
jgi:peptidyl-prolyl cis-trans isomerase SurA